MQLNWIRKSALLLIILGSSFLISCKKESDIMLMPRGVPTATPASATSLSGAATDAEVNDWILSNMRTYYYWNDKVPANPDKSLTPDVFFKSLLNTYNATANPTGDRFSWIQQSADELKASLSGESKTTGMEYSYFLKPQNTNEVVASVLYVLPGSAADRAGFRRGDIISKVNGITLLNSPGNAAHYSTLLLGGSDTKTLTLAKVDYDPANASRIVGVSDSDQARTLTATVFQENPILLDSVYSVGGRTIGYLVYNQFVPKPNGSTTNTYDQKLSSVFGKFKAQGVNELVLDFRYNPGGYVSSATHLGSLIAKGVSGTKSVFARKEWNASIASELRKQYGDDFFYDYMPQQANNIGANLNQVYVLTTRGTASASELVINGLRPYFNQQVYTIGQTSYGKNVGSITIFDETKRIKWGMQPIVSKTFNRDNESNYSTGFVPKVELAEGLVKKQLGDLTERYLSEAVFQITGSRMARRSAVEGVTPAVGSSIERKAGGSNMFIEQPR